MAELHWFPVFVADWLTSDAITLMLPEQEGAFFRLLLRAWGKGEAEPSLSSDDATLATLSRLGKRWAKLGPLVRAEFTERDGRLYNAKLSAVWAEQQGKHGSAVERGKLGARTRLANLKTVSSSAPSSAQAQLKQLELEQELERETAKASSSADDRTRLLDGLPDETMRLSWSSELNAARDGMHGVPLTEAQISQACRDYVGNGHLKSPSLRHFRAFLKSAGQPVVARPPSVGPAEDAAESAWQEVLAMVPRWQRREITADVHQALAPPMRRGISKIGGFKVLSETRAEQLTWVKKEFLAAFRASPATVPA